MTAKIRVLFDELGFREPHGGVSRYFTEMIKRLPKDVAWRLSAVCSNNVFLRSEPFCLPEAKQDVHVFIRDVLHGKSFLGVSHFYRLLSALAPKIFPSGERVNRKAFAAAIRADDFDILHLTDPHPYYNWWELVCGRKPIVATVHDLIPELFYSTNRVKKMRSKLVKEAAHIISVSKNTKNDLVRLYGVSPDKVTVIYHGYLAPREKNLSFNNLTVKPLTTKYLLFVGKRSGYKNFNFFIRAVASLLKADRKLSVFCTGSAFSQSELEEIANLGLQGRVSQGFVPDCEMPSIFAHAAVFVYPSKYEGFGIPILDAFAAGCPVVLSRCSCFPEVAGDAACYFPDGDSGMLCEQVTAMIEDFQLRREMVKRGRERVKDFSWQKCADETAEVYHKVISAAKV